MDRLLATGRRRVLASRKTRKNTRNLFQQPDPLPRSKSAVAGDSIYKRAFPRVCRKCPLGLRGNRFRDCQYSRKQKREREIRQKNRGRQRSLEAQNGSRRCLGSRNIRQSESTKR